MVEPVEFTTSLSAAYCAVFESYDPAICVRAGSPAAIGYPIDSYQLTRTQWNGLCSAVIDSATDRTAYISVIEGHKEQFLLTGKHWIVELPEYPYPTMTGWSGIEETAVYSAVGGWGVVISHMQFAVASGSAQFVSRLATNMPEFGVSAVPDFIAAVRRDRGIGHGGDAWAVSVLERVYGAEVARRVRS